MTGAGTELLTLVRDELAAHPDMAPDPIRDFGRERAGGLIKGTETWRRNAWPFHLAGYVASVELGMGPAAAARLIGRDRKTLWWGVPRIEDRRDDPEFDAFIDHLAVLARARLSGQAMGLAA